MSDIKPFSKTTEPRNDFPSLTSVASFINNLIISFKAPVYVPFLRLSLTPLSLCSFNSLAQRVF